MNTTNMNTRMSTNFLHLTMRSHMLGNPTTGSGMMTMQDEATVTDHANASSDHSDRAIMTPDEQACVDDDYGDDYADIDVFDDATGVAPSSYDASMSAVDACHGDDREDYAVDPDEFEDAAEYITNQAWTSELVPGMSKVLNAARDREYEIVSGEKKSLFDEPSVDADYPGAQAVVAKANEISRESLPHIHGSGSFGKGIVSWIILKARAARERPHVDSVVVVPQFPCRR